MSLRVWRYFQVVIDIGWALVLAQLLPRCLLARQHFGHGWRQVHRRAQGHFKCSTMQAARSPTFTRMASGAFRHCMLALPCHLRWTAAVFQISFISRALILNLLL